MADIEQLKTEIEELSEEQFARLRSWFAQKDWEQWDRQIEEDSRDGKLDFLREEMEEEKDHGNLEEI